MPKRKQKPGILVCPASPRVAAYAARVSTWLEGLSDASIISHESEAKGKLFVLVVSEGRTRGGKEFWDRMRRLQTVTNVDNIVMLVVGDRGRGPKIDIRRVRMQSEHDVRFLLEMIGKQLRIPVEGPYISSWWRTFPSWDDDYFMIERRRSKIANTTWIRETGDSVDEAGRHTLAAIQACSDIERILLRGTIDAHEGAMVRYYAVYLWLDNERAAADLSSIVERLAGLLEMSIVARLPAVRGSFFKRFILGTKALLSRPEAYQLWLKVEHALKIVAIEKRRAETNVSLAEALASISATAEKTTNATMLVGSILYIKRGDDVFVDTLTIDQMMEYEKNPDILALSARILQSKELSMPKPIHALKSGGDDE